MPNYKVKVTAFADVLVINANDEEEALELAVQQINLGNLESDECEIRSTVPDSELESARKNADFVVEDE